MNDKANTGVKAAALAVLAVGAVWLGEVALARADIDIAEATRIALERVPGTVKEVELERGVFEVEIIAKDGVEHEVLVDALTGSIVKVRVDD